MSRGIHELRVLLIEPSSTQRRIVNSHFQLLGISKYENMQSGSAALEYLHAGNEVDLVISAMHLPDMTCKEVIQDMRTDHKLMDTLVMLISSETSFRSLDPIKQAGATAILPKPFSVDQLRKAIVTNIEGLRVDTIDLDVNKLQTLKVLVVDDSRMARRHIIRTLSQIGLGKFSEAGDGAEAVPLINDGHYDFIVTDYNMPEMDGKVLIDYIRQQSKNPDVPVMMVTTEENNAKLEAVQQAGVSAICNKPFETTNVKQLLQNILAA